MGKEKKRHEIGMRGAALLQFASKYTNVLAQLFITAVLARLISPEDFGLLSIVVVFSSFFQLFSDMGIGAAIIQYRDLTEEDYGSLFVFSGILAVLLAFLFCLAAFPISLFYGEPRLVSLCCFASPALVFGTLNMVPNGLMLRNKKFKIIAFRLVSSTLISGTIAIVSAYLGAGTYSLIIQTVLSSLIILIWNILANPIREINIHFCRVLKRVFSYSAYQFGFSFINYFSRNLDNLVIGRVLGAESLGYYDKAYKLTTYPMNNLSSVVASVIQPYMAENQNHPERILDCWLKIEKLLSLLGAIVSSIFIVAAPEIVEIVYGSQWAAAVPLFQVLSISIYFQMLGNPSGAFFQSLGRTDLMFKVGLINTCLTLCGLVVGILIGSLQMVAVCVSIAFCLHVVPLAYFLLCKGMKASLAILKKFIPDVSISVISIIICFLFSNIMPHEVLIRFTCKLLLIVMICLIGYKITGQSKVLLSLFKRR